jgi:hypothetical protein
MVTIGTVSTTDDGTVVVIARDVVAVHHDGAWRCGSDYPLSWIQMDHHKPVNDHALASKLYAEAKAAFPRD